MVYNFECVCTGKHGGRKQKRRETAKRASVSMLFVITMSCLCEGQQGDFW